MPYDDHALPDTPEPPSARREAPVHEIDTPWPGAPITPAECIARAVIVLVLLVMVAITVWVAQS